MDTSNSSQQPFDLNHLGNETHLLREVMLTSQALINIFSRAVGIPSSRLVVLRLLAIEHPEGLGVMEMARCLGVNPAAVTRQVQEMERLLLIQRQDDPHDRRRSSVQLTPEGRELFEEVHERMHQFETIIQANCSADDISTTTKVLTQLRSAIQQLQI